MWNCTPARTPAAARIAAGLLLLLAAGPAAAQEPARAAERGALLYEIHCASCHGDGGAGDGPAAAELEVPPTDLTGLAAAHGGELPAEEIRRSIDGRDEVTGHGRRDMPIWGLTFQERGRDSDQEAEVRGRVEDLLAYLRSIQRAGEVEQPSGDGGGTGP